MRSRRKTLMGGAALLWAAGACSAPGPGDSTNGGAAGKGERWAPETIRFVLDHDRVSPAICGRLTSELYSSEHDRALLSAAPCLVAEDDAAGALTLTPAPSDALLAGLEVLELEVDRGARLVIAYELQEGGDVVAVLAALAAGAGVHVFKDQARQVVEAHRREIDQAPELTKAWLEKFVSARLGELLVGWWPSRDPLADLQTDVEIQNARFPRSAFDEMQREAPECTRRMGFLMEPPTPGWSDRSVDRNGIVNIYVHGCEERTQNGDNSVSGGIVLFAGPPTVVLDEPSGLDRTFCFVFVNHSPPQRGRTPRLEFRPEFYSVDTSRPATEKWLWVPGEHHWRPRLAIGQTVYVDPPGEVATSESPGDTPEYAGHEYDAGCLAESELVEAVRKGAHDGAPQRVVVRSQLPGVTPRSTEFSTAGKRSPTVRAEDVL